MRTLPLLACLALLTTAAGLAFVPAPAQAQARPQPAKTVRMPATVYFAYDDDQLSAEMREYLAAVAAHFVANAAAVVQIDGHADRREAKTLGSDYVIGLSQRRANNVRNYLVERGVADNAIITQAFGHTRPSAPDATLGQDRRVVVAVGTGSGW